jgi:hypothetical protein
VKKQLSTILPFVRDLGSFSADADAIAAINEIRELLWNDEAIRLRLFRTDDMPVPLWTPAQTCGRPCGVSAITLPCDVTMATEIRVNGVAAEITEMALADRHRECLTAERMPKRLLERDPPGNSRIVFSSSEEEPDCPLIGVEYLDPEGNVQRESLELSRGQVATRTAVQRFIGITFPERRGTISVSRDDITFASLGAYQPAVTVPEHVWFLLNAGCDPCGRCAEFRGYREPMPVCHLTDLIEFGDRPTWRLAWQLYQMFAKSALTPDEGRALERITAQLAAIGEAGLRSTNTPSATAFIPSGARRGFGAAAMLGRRA